MTRRSTLSVMIFPMLVIACGGHAHAVEVDSGGAGEALIVPVWSTANGNNTLLSLAAGDQVVGQSSPLAVKMRVRDQQGDVRFSANIYLTSGRHVWTAALLAAEGGGSRITSSSGDCALVEEQGQVVVMDGQRPVEAEVGLIEFFLMGSLVGDAATLASEQSCEALAARWNEGAWEQSSDSDLEWQQHSLRATAHIIQVEKGTSYSLQATALSEFSNLVQHTKPADALPNLTSAHDEGTATGATRSRQCHAGTCFEDTWEKPIDAVAVALMTHRLRGDYLSDPGLGAKTELLLSYPLAHHYRQLGVSNLSQILLSVRAYDRAGERTQDWGFMDPPIIGPEFPASFRQYQSTSVGALTFGEVLHNPGNDPVPVTPTEILGIPHQQFFRLYSGEPLAPSGWFFVGFDRFPRSPALVSNSGTAYSGAPAITQIFQEVTNAALVAADGVQQRANYGVNSDPATFIGVYE